jgi:hypothetical protein
MGRVRMLPTPASGVRLADAVLPPGTPESVASRRVTQSRNPGRRMMGLMDIELLVVPGCRNEEPAATLLRFALVQAALRRWGNRGAEVSLRSDGRYRVRVFQLDEHRQTVGEAERIGWYDSEAKAKLVADLELNVDRF